MSQNHKFLRQCGTLTAPKALLSFSCSEEKPYHRGWPAAIGPLWRQVWAEQDMAAVTGLPGLWGHGDLPLLGGKRATAPAW